MALYVNALQAIFYIFVGLIAGNIVGKLARKLLSEFEINKYYMKRFNETVFIEEITSFMFSMMIYIAAFVLALNKLGVLLYVIGCLLSIAIILFLIWFVPKIYFSVINMFSQKKMPAIGESIEVSQIKGIVRSSSMTGLIVDTKIGRLKMPKKAF